MDAVDEGMEAGKWMSVSSKWPSSCPGIEACSSPSHGSYLLMFTALEMKTEAVKTGVGCHSLLQGVFLTQDQTQVSCIAGWFFTIWITREAL